MSSAVCALFKSAFVMVFKVHPGETATILSVQCSVSMVVWVAASENARKEVTVTNLGKKRSATPSKIIHTTHGDLLPDPWFGYFLIERRSALCGSMNTRRGFLSETSRLPKEWAKSSLRELTSWMKKRFLILRPCKRRSQFLTPRLDPKHRGEQKNVSGR